MQNCWTLIRTGASLDEVLGVVLQEGLRAISSFVMLTAVDDTLRFVVRGGASIQLGTAPLDEVVRGEGAATWVDGTVDDAIVEVRLLANGSSDAAALPLLSGVTLANSIAICREPAALGGPADDLVIVAPTVADGSEAEAASREPDDVSSVSFDHLFGETVRPPSLEPEAAIDSVDEATPDDASSSPEVEPRSGYPSDVTLNPMDTINPVDEDDLEPELIDSVPWDDVSAPGSDIPSSDDSDADDREPVDDGIASPTVDFEPTDDVGVTVDRATLLARSQQSDPLIVGPTVLATRCIDGHLSPPYAELCRVCGSEIPPQEPFTAPRPTLGVLRLSTGDTVTLDRGVILGRAPRVSEARETDRPNVVKLASPGKDISRSHLEVKIDGWHVFVVDLDSTNGTSVTLPGEPPRRLRPNDQLAIERGTVVELADEVTFTFDVIA